MHGMLCCFHPGLLCWRYFFHCAMQHLLCRDLMGSVLLLSKLPGRHDVNRRVSHGNAYSMASTLPFLLWSFPFPQPQILPALLAKRAVAAHPCWLLTRYFTCWAPSRGWRERHEPFSHPQQGGSSPAPIQQHLSTGWDEAAPRRAAIISCETVITQTALQHAGQALNSDPALVKPLESCFALQH